MALIFAISFAGVSSPVGKFGLNSAMTIPLTVALTIVTATRTMTIIYIYIYIKRRARVPRFISSHLPIPPLFALVLLIFFFLKMGFDQYVKSAVERAKISPRTTKEQEISRARI